MAKSIVINFGLVEWIQFMGTWIDSIQNNFDLAGSDIYFSRLHLENGTILSWNETTMICITLDETAQILKSFLIKFFREFSHCCFSFLREGK